MGKNNIRGKRLMRSFVQSDYIITMRYYFLFFSHHPSPNDKPSYFTEVKGLRCWAK